MESWIEFKIIKMVIGWKLDILKRNFDYVKHAE